jgi:hypothetical protein
MIRGSCLCNGVRYEAEGPLGLIARCHCTQCRKASGAEFATNGSVPDATFRIVSGEELLRSFAWSPGQERHFCGRCGSPLFKRDRARPGMVRLRLGGTDEGVTRGPMFHVFAGERPSWSEICDQLPQYDHLTGRADKK